MSPIKVLKSSVLFTAEDIERMFPADETEKAKLEIEEEIHKLRASSEQAVAAATLEMKAEFRERLGEALREIQGLKDALTAGGTMPSDGSSGVQVYSHHCSSG